MYEPTQQIWYRLYLYLVFLPFYGRRASGRRIELDPKQRSILYLHSERAKPSLNGALME
jgi:hypothetical protein